MQATGFLKRFHVAELAGLMRRSFARFPVATLFALASFVLTVYVTHDGGKHLAWLMVTVPGFVFAAAAEMYGEARGLSRAAKALGTWGGGAMMVIAGTFETQLGTSLFLWYVAVILFFVFAPYLRKTGTEDSFWYYNYKHFMTFVAGVASALVLVFGMIMITASIQYLFEINFFKGIYADLWAFCFMIFLPVYFLSNLPAKFDYEKQECVVPQACSFIANYLLVPLSLTYAFVLYAYMAKIALMWELPRGNLAYMVTGFGICGVLTHLAIFPLRETGVPLLQQFYRYFYKIMIAPVILLGIGIYTRIAQYGVTEERYMLVLCFVWFASLCVIYGILPRKLHLKYVPMILCVLMLVASVSPFSADIVSTASQKQRLQVLLAKAGVIRPDGTIGKAQNEIIFEDEKEITSIVDYFAQGRKKKMQNIAPWVLAGIDNEHYYSAEPIVKGWGISYAPKWQKNRGKVAESYLAVATARDVMVKVGPYHYFVPMNFHATAMSRSMTFQDETGKDIELTYAVINNDELSVTVNGKHVLFALAPLIEKVSKIYDRNVPQDKAEIMTLRKTENGVSVMLRIKTVTYEANPSGMNIKSGTADIYFTPAP